MRFEKEKKEIIARFRRLYESGMINMFEGNISLRCGNTVLITPSQMEKDRIWLDHIIEMDLNGKIKNVTGVNPSSEYKMHLEIYRLRPDVNAVVHTHSCYATAYALARKPIANAMAELYMFFGGEIPVCSYAEPGSDALFAEFPRYFVDEDRDAVLLANHGLVTASHSLANAYSLTEAAEKIAKIGLMAERLGGGISLTDEEKDALLARYKNRSRG